MSWVCRQCSSNRNREQLSCEGVVEALDWTLTTNSLEVPTVALRPICIPTRLDPLSQLKNYFTQGFPSGLSSSSLANLGQPLSSGILRTGKTSQRDTNHSLTDALRSFAAYGASKAALNHMARVSKMANACRTLR